MKKIKHRIWGIVLLVLGVMALLQGIEQFNFGLAFWPVINVLVGGALVWGSFRHHGAIWFLLGLGLWIGGIGLFGILGNAGVTTITAGDIARFGWPILLVAAGVSILFGKPSWLIGKSSWATDMERHRGWEHWGRFGAYYHGQQSWLLDGDIDINHGIGEVILDLSTADINEGAHRVKVGVSIGELLIRVPDNINLEVNASVSIGELNVLGEKRSGISGLTIQRNLTAIDSKIDLHVKAKLGIGELNVVRVPTSRGLDG